MEFLLLNEVLKNWIFFQLPIQKSAPSNQSLDKKIQRVDKKKTGQSLRLDKVFLANKKNEKLTKRLAKTTRTSLVLQTRNGQDKNQMLKSTSIYSIFTSDLGLLGH